MFKYVVKRIMLAIVSMLIVCTVTFFAMNAAADRSATEKAKSAAVKAVLEKRFHLDQPVGKRL